MKHFAILRHKKIKNGRHLVSAGLHNVRGVQTDNADKDATPPVVLIGSAKPHRDVRDQLHAREITKIRKGGNVAVEMLMAASPEWWADKGWVAGRQLEDQTEELQTTLAEWTKLNTAYLRQRSGDRVASLVLHLDESTPHLQALVLPVERRARKGTDDFKWKLDAEIEMGSPGRLIQRQTEYAKAMAPLGLVRGEQGAEIGSETHIPLKEHYAILSAARDEASTALANSQNMESWSTNTVLIADETATNLLNKSKADAKRLLAEAEASIAADRQQAANVAKWDRQKILAEATAEAAAIAAKAAEDAQEARRVAEIAASEAAAKILEDAKRDRTVLLLAAEASIAEDRRLLGRDQIDLKHQRKDVESKNKQLDDLIAKLAEAGAYFKALPERVRAFLERDGQAAEAAQAVIKPGGVLEQAKALRTEGEFSRSLGLSPTDLVRAEIARRAAEKGRG